MSRSIMRTFRVDGVLTDVTAAKLSDATGTYGVKETASGTVVVADGTAMTKVSTGTYIYTSADLADDTAYTAWVEFEYAGAIYRWEQELPVLASPLAMSCEYASLVNDIARHCYGIRPTASDVITDSVASADQATDILRAIAKGLQFVYSAHRWTFLRPRVPISTYAPYTTGTITVDANGNVTGTDTVFPSYSASAYGKMTIPSVGTYAIETYTSGTELVLADYDGGAITTSTTYTIGFNTYPLPSGIETLEGQLTYPEGSYYPSEPLKLVAESDIRRLLSSSNTPGVPTQYALVTETFDATVGSGRYVVFWPVPDDAHVLTAIGIAELSMLTATNKYPLGGTLLGPCITEACLAAAERDIQGMDEHHPNAVHHRALLPLLAMAIQKDKEQGTPETLGVAQGSERSSVPVGAGRNHIYFDNVGGYTGWLW